MSSFLRNTNVGIFNFPGLIGDTLGAIPTIQELCKRGNKVYVNKTETQYILECIPEYNNSVFIYDSKDIDSLNCNYVIDFDVSIIFKHNISYNFYMSKAYFHYVFKEIPLENPKVEFKLFDTEAPNYDILISPYARSLPPEQKLSPKQWEEFIDSKNIKTVGILGNSKYDDPNFISLRNKYTLEFDSPFPRLIQLFKNCNEFIGVVTGTSHLAYHLNIPSTLFTKQGISGWGVNPTANHIQTF